MRLPSDSTVLYSVHVSIYFAVLHSVVIRNEKVYSTTPRCQTRFTTALDDTPSSSRAVEGGLASLSRRAPSHAMLDDVVSQKPPRGDARWHAVSKHVRSKGLDSLLSVPSRAESPGEGHQKPCQAALDTTPLSSTS